MIWHTESILVGMDEQGHMQYVVRKNGDVLLYSVKKANLGEWEKWLEADKVNKLEPKIWKLNSK